ncbi:unnamed protein product [Calicophoron daubneyi]|uniref:Uncharacterized protein n=1 Tax=Calicophoron daubneyi TaxID=300641 RepID=A0AAV2TJ93_CALDB
MSLECLCGPSGSQDEGNFPQKNHTTTKMTGSEEQHANLVQYYVPEVFGSLKRKVPDIKHQKDFACRPEVENEEDRLSPVERYLPSVFGNLRREVPDPKHQTNFVSRLDDENKVNSVSPLERYSPRVFGNLKRETHNASRQENSVSRVGSRKEEKHINSVKRYFSFNGMHTNGSSKVGRVRPVSLRLIHQPAVPHMCQVQ